MKLINQYLLEKLKINSNISVNNNNKDDINEINDKLFNSGHHSGLERE